MKFLFSGICFFLSLLAYCQDTWVQLADFPGTGRDDAVGFSINGIGYTGTGVTTNGNFQSDFYSYDPRIDEWKNIAGIPGEPRQYCSSFALNGFGYIFGGQIPGNQYISELLRYDPGTDRWDAVTPCPAAPRASAVAFSIGPVGYVAGGKDHNNTFGDFWAYYPGSDEWVQKANLPGGPRYEAVAFTIGGFGFLGLGKDAEGNCRKDFWKYIPLADKWERMADFEGNICSYSMGYAIDAFGGFVFTGMNKDNTVLNEIWHYDVRENRWLLFPEITPFGQRRGVAAFEIEHCLYTVTGIDEKFSRNRELWEWCLSPEKAFRNFQLYPNPARNTLRIDLGDYPQDLTVEFFSPDGSLLNKVNVKGGDSSHEFDIEALNAGIYLIRLLDKKGEFLNRRRFVVIGE